MRQPPAFKKPMANTHHPSTGPLSEAVIAATRCRPVGQRFTRSHMPQVGDTVGVRLHEGGEVLAGVVTNISSLTEPHPGYSKGHRPSRDELPDPNVWRVVTNWDTRTPIPRPDGHDGFVYELVEDPWPQITIRVDPPPGQKRPRIFTTTREERIAPLGGWLPAGRIGD